jgi:hypothetical protein
VKLYEASLPLDGEPALVRKLHKHGPADTWSRSPQQAARLQYDELRIFYPPPSEREPGQPTHISEVRETATGTPQEIRDAILELDRVERSGMPYVVLTWFLRTALPGSRLAWTASPAERQRVVGEAIERGSFVTDKLDNPKQPGQQVTTVRLNRSNAEVGEVLRASKNVPRFDPVPLRGEPLSQQIIRERR